MKQGRGRARPGHSRNQPHEAGYLVSCGPTRKLGLCDQTPRSALCARPFVALFVLSWASAYHILLRLIPQDPPTAPVLRIVVYWLRQCNSFSYILPSAEHFFVCLSLLLACRCPLRHATNHLQPSGNYCSSTRLRHFAWTCCVPFAQHAHFSYIYVLLICATCTLRPSHSTPPPLPLPVRNPTLVPIRHKYTTYSFHQWPATLSSSPRQDSRGVIGERVRNALHAHTDAYPHATVTFPHDRTTIPLSIGSPGT